MVTPRLLPLSNCHRAYCLAAAGAIPCFCCCILNSEILIRWLIGSHNFSGVFLKPAVDNAQHFTWLVVLCTTLILTCYGHCWHSMRIRIYATVGRPSVCPVICMRLLWVCCCFRRRRPGDIKRLLHCRHAAANARSTTLSADVNKKSLDWLLYKITKFVDTLYRCWSIWSMNNNCILC